MAMPQRSRGAESSKNAQPGSILLVVHEFNARSPDELNLAKGDRIELIEKDDDFGDGWYLGKHLHTGDKGLFPEGWFAFDLTSREEIAESAISVYNLCSQRHPQHFNGSETSRQVQHIHKRDQR